MGLSKTSGHIQIKIKMLYPSQEPPAPTKATNQDLKDMDVLCTFKVKIDSQKLEIGCVIPSDHIQFKIKIPSSSQEPPASSKALNEDLKDMDVLCTFKIKIESQNMDHVRIKDKWPYWNKEKIANLGREQSPKSGLKGHGCSLHLQNQDREPKFGSWIYQIPVTYPNQDQDAKPQSWPSSVL